MGAVAGDNSESPLSMFVGTGPRSDGTVVYVPIAAFTASSANVGNAAGAKQKVRVLEFYLLEASGGTAESLKFSDSVNSADLCGAVTPTPGTPFQAAWNPNGHFETGAAGRVQVVKGASTISCGGWAIIQFVDVNDP